MDEANPYHAPAAPAHDRPQGDERNLAVLAHLATFAGYLVPFGNILGPLVIFLVKKDDSPYIRHHAAEALNFQITVTILAVVFLILCFVLIGFPLLLVLMVADLVLTIVAAIKASDGVHYRYPMCMRLVR